jgi:hypothetical protein
MRAGRRIGTFDANTRRFHIWTCIPEIRSGKDRAVGRRTFASVPSWPYPPLPSPSPPLPLPSPPPPGPAAQPQPAGVPRDAVANGDGNHPIIRHSDSDRRKPGARSLARSNRRVQAYVASNCYGRGAYSPGAELRKHCHPQPLKIRILHKRGEYMPSDESDLSLAIRAALAAPPFTARDGLFAAIPPAWGDGAMGRWGDGLIDTPADPTRKAVGDLLSALLACWHGSRCRCGDSAGLGGSLA